jgi:hypothetical protein
MKRKDTKFYNALVDEYCSNRFEFETAEDLIHSIEEIIEKSQKKYAEIVSSDSALKAWFDAFVSMNRSFVEMNKMNKDYYEGRMESYGKLLVMDYGEDLEKLYENYKLNIN